MRRGPDFTPLWAGLSPWLNDFVHGGYGQLSSNYNPETGKPDYPASWFWTAMLIATLSMLSSSAWLWAHLGHEDRAAGCSTWDACRVLGQPGGHAQRTGSQNHRRACPYCPPAVLTVATSPLSCLGRGRGGLRAVSPQKALAWSNLDNLDIVQMCPYDLTRRGSFGHNKDNLDIVRMCPNQGRS